MDPTTRNLAWKFNWYRQSELEGSLLLGRMIRTTGDGYLISRLTTHCADEARHSELWSACLAELKLPYIRIHRSYQSLFNDHGGTPTNLVEVLAFTQIFERRVHKRFTEESKAPGVPAAARTTFETMIRDERDHLEWVREWLQAQPGSAALLNKYIAIDNQVYLGVLPYEAQLWTMPGLGEESPTPTP